MTNDASGSHGASQNVTTAVADFAVHAEFTDLPEATRERAKILLVDAVASALAGRQASEAGKIEALCQTLGGPGRSPVIGGTPISPAGAVMLNGYLVTATTVCDVHLPILCHVCPEVLPPALAIGTERSVSGREFLLAFALGLETTTRIGTASNYAAFRARGWHSPGVFGPFGGAVAAGRLLRLDTAAMVNALGLAGSQAAGTFAHWGTPTIKFHQSRGALSGYLAALLAQQGFTASPDILTAEDGGLFKTYSDGGDPALVTADLGRRWELENISLRQWPLASSLQAMATALFGLLSRPDVNAEKIAKVTIGLSRRSFGMHGQIPWQTRFEALLSAPYVAAVILTDRTCWMEQFTPSRIADPAVGAFANQQIQVRADDEVPDFGATAEVELRDGNVMRDVRLAPHGSPEDPLSLSDVAAKFAQAASPLLDSSASARMLDRLAQIEQVANVDAALFGCLPAL